MSRNSEFNFLFSAANSGRRESVYDDFDSRQNRKSRRGFLSNVLIRNFIDVAPGEEIILGPESSLIVARRGGLMSKGLIRTSNRRDRVVGLNNSRVNLVNQVVGIDNSDVALLETLGGDDLLMGVSCDKANRLSAEFAIGISNTSGAVINTGSGDDMVIAKAINAGAANIFGAYNYSEFKMGSGEDVLKGRAVNFSSDTRNLFGIFNDGRYKPSGPDAGEGDAATSDEFDGVIDAGIDSDRVEGIGSGQAESICGIVNFGVFKLDDGDDTLIGRATGVASFQSHGISNLGIIEMGDGDDVVIGSQVNYAGSPNELDAGIYNDGIISTGKGEDVVDALVGGFLSGYTLWSPGLIDLGEDNDVLKGFGTGDFDGGSGEDSILLGEGRYTVVLDQDGIGTLEKEGSSLIMSIRNFEMLGGALGGLTDLVSGTFEINADQQLIAG